MPTSKSSAVNNASASLIVITSIRLKWRQFNPSAIDYKGVAAVVITIMTKSSAKNGAGVKEEYS